MNRERLLFVAVLAILGLWFFLRTPPDPAEGAESRQQKLERGPVADAAHPERRLADIPRQPWTLVTNVKPHPRPLDELYQPEPAELPNIWPPTSRSVSTERLRMLRRDAAQLQEGEAQVQLPELPGGAGNASGTEQEERVDAWKSYGTAYSGRVTAIRAAGTRLTEPKQPWPTDATVMGKEWKFLRALALLPDPLRAQEEGVTEVEARSGIGALKQKYPDEIAEFVVARSGKQRGYFIGLRKFLDVQRDAGSAFDPRVRAAQQLVDEGLKDRNESLLEWALTLLDEARGLVPAGAQAPRKAILLLMIKAASALNKDELVLSLAIDHLKAFPDEAEVCERVGDVLASRSFALLPFAAAWYRRGATRPSAQRKLVEVLVRQGRFEEAREALGRLTASGAEADLLRARVSLALGELDQAATHARRHTTGEAAAEAHQILGAVAYANGDAATAETEFLQAVQADPARSKAYSDLGFALAVQGKAADARKCFERAALDTVDNPVAPKLGEAYLKLVAGEGRLRAADAAEKEAEVNRRFEKEKREEAASLRSQAADDFEAAATMLATLQDDNPNDLLVRYMAAYSKERTGNLAEAAALYRKTIDDDYRYRIAIARLGLVQARRAEAGERQLAAEAIAHLSKAVELNVSDPVLPYLLARFLVGIGQEPALASEMFARAAQATSGARAFWAQLGQAWLAYADEKTDEQEVKRLLNRLLDRIKESQPPGTTEQKLMENEVYKAAAINLQIVQENEQKVDRAWDFAEYGSRPPDWKFSVINPMRLGVEKGKGLIFSGEIGYGGRTATDKLILDSFSANYDSKKDELNGGSFWELEVTGVVPDDPGASLGIGLLNPGRGDEAGAGVKVRRKASSGNLELKLDGGERQVFKNVKGRDYVAFENVPWPAGEFHLRIEVIPEYGAQASQRRSLGRFRLFLNGTEAFEAEFGDEEGERCNTFGRGRASQPVTLYLWVEGRDGDSIKEIQVKSVKLTVEKK